nr:MAG TPA: hypothetical protein [Caudoviricetes sp.]
MIAHLFCNSSYLHCCLRFCLKWFTQKLNLFSIIFS